MAFSEATIISNEFTAINDCTCQGYNSVYECTVSGGIATIWKGTAFDCQSGANEIALLHSNNFTLQRAETCNNGAIKGESICVQNGTFTSRLTVNVSAEMNGSTIVCAYDTEGDTPVVGSALLTINTEPFPPPTDVELVEKNDTHLSFSWNEVSSNCPSIHYQIMASSCGDCPNTTLTNKATCTGDYTRLTTQQCSFAVQTVVCDDNIAGDVSNKVYVPQAEAESIPNDIMKGNDSNTPSSIVIASGATVGAMFLAVVFITSLFIATLVMLIRSKRAVRALRAELVQLNAKMVKEQPVIYEEIAQLQESLKSSSPSIDIGENTAYVSVNTYAKVST